MDQIFSNYLCNGVLSEQRNSSGVQPLMVCNSKTLYPALA